MKKTMYWIIWGLALVVINLGAIPIALFSLFGTPEGTSIFSVDYLIAFSIFLLANIVSIQLFIAARRQDMKGFLFGLLLAIIEAISFVLFINTVDFWVCFILAMIGVVGAAVLLIKSFIRQSIKGQ
jgi:hypothetical protein